METLILILIILAVLSFPVQLGFMEKRWSMGLWLLVVAVFIYFSHTLAIEQSYGKFSQQLSNSTFMTDLVVIQVIEALAGLLLAIFMIRKHFGEPVKKFFSFATYLPGILVFPALFLFSSFAYFNFTGVDFQLLAVILAISFPLILFGIHLFFKWLIPEFDVRAEVKFTLHIFQLLGGIVLSVQYLKLPVNTTGYDYALHIKELMILGSVALLIIGGGAIYNQIRMTLKMRILK
nr:hypothetical protein [uncultured Draconibacterium sp.]